MNISYKVSVNLLFVSSIFMSFILNRGNSFRFTGAVFIMASAILFFWIFETNRIQIPRVLFVILISLALIMIAQPLDFEYTQTYATINFFILIALSLFLLYMPVTDKKYQNAICNIDGVLYVLLLITSVYYIIHSAYNDSEYIIFPAIGDVNYTAVFIFMIFMIANKKKYYSGIILAFYYGIFLSTSRSYLLLIIMFYLVKGLKYLMGKNQLCIREHFFFNKTIFLFMAILILLCVSIIFSYIWVYYVSSAGYVDHREGLNDVSNRMRFISLVRAIEMIRDDPRLLFWGCGSNLFDALGVYSDGTLPLYMGIRIVQPHNSLISLLLKLGVVPALLYFFLLSNLIAILLKKENLEYIIPYVINAMIMHSFFERGWLIFWVYILVMDENEKGWIKTKKKIRFI